SSLPGINGNSLLQLNPRSGGFQFLSNLKCLNLEGNRFVRVPDEFSNHPSLKDLSMKYNPFKDSTLASKSNSRELLDSIQNSSPSSLLSTQSSLNTSMESGALTKHQVLSGCILASKICVDPLCREAKETQRRSSFPCQERLKI